MNCVLLCLIGGDFIEKIKIIVFKYQKYFWQYRIFGCVFLENWKRPIFYIDYINCFGDCYPICLFIFSKVYH